MNLSAMARSIYQLTALAALLVSMSSSGGSAQQTTTSTATKSLSPSKIFTQTKKPPESVTKAVSGTKPTVVTPPTKKPEIPKEPIEPAKGRNLTNGSGGSSVPHVPPDAKRTIGPHGSIVDRYSDGRMVTRTSQGEIHKIETPPGFDGRRKVLIRGPRGRRK